MPRKARIDAPGAIHHVIIRGIENKNIFFDNADRENFVERISALVSETRTGCYAWALMDNHVHLLLKTGLTPIATIMRRVLTGYALFFNRRHRRHGYLFQNRYKSILCEEELYLKELVRYIHLNPLRAGVIKDFRQLSRYKWCGHGAIMGTTDIDWQDTAYILKFFGQKIKPARRTYRDFVFKGLGQGKRPDLVGGGLLRSIGGWTELNRYRSLGIRLKGDERILGSSGFVDRVLQGANEQLAEKYRLRALNISIESLVDEISRYYEIEAEELRGTSKKRTVTQARRVLCYIAVRKLHFSGTDLSKKLGIKPATVSLAAELGSRLPEINRIRKKILSSFQI